VPTDEPRTRLGQRLERGLRLGRFQRPAVALSTLFGLLVLGGTALLLLPVARAGEGGAPLLTALFTSTSAVCVVGLTTVDTATYWSTFGHVVIAALVQIGGFGITTLASLVALLISRRLGLRTRLMAQAESRALDLGDIKRVLLGVALITAVVQSAIALVLTLRFWLAYDYSLPQAIWYGTFHSITAYNNAGFALFSDNLVGFVSDWWICIPICVAVIVGGLGFPVLFELIRERRSARTWSAQVRLTLVTTAVLLVGGFALILAFEWNNPQTLAGLDVPTRVLASIFQSVQPRTAGFNTLNYGEMENTSLLTTNLLMFVGGGSASSAGGIKVTTLAVLVLALRAELRGDADVNAFRRRMPVEATRQALAVSFAYCALLMTGTLALLVLAPGVDLSSALFETGSALATVGLSTGITPALPADAQWLLALLMFIGRLGPLTLASAIALRQRRQLYRWPIERPIIG
jgi:potassium uptake TrkH family protein